MSTVAGSEPTSAALAFDGYANPVRGAEAVLHSPSAVCVDPTAPGHVLIGSDENQKCIRRLSPDGRW